MEPVSFFTPVVFQNGGRAKNFFEKAGEFADDYFYLWGRRVCAPKENFSIIQWSGKPVPIFLHDTQSWLKTTAKISLYLASILAAGFLIANPVLAVAPLALIASKVASFALVILSLTMLAAKMYFRMPGTLQAKDLRIERRIEITEELKSRVQQEVKLNSKPRRFTLNNCELTFVIAPRSLLQEDITNRDIASEIIFQEDLKYLEVAQATSFEVEVEGQSMTVMAEKCIKMDELDALKRSYNPNLRDAVAQFAIFIIKTGFNHVTMFSFLQIGWKSYQIQQLVSRGNASEGIFGGPNSRSVGLIHCVGTKEAFDDVLRIAKENGISPPPGLDEKDIKERIEKKTAIHQFLQTQRSSKT